VIGWIKVPGDGASAVGVEVNGVRRRHGFGSATNAVLVWFWFCLSLVLKPKPKRVSHKTQDTHAMSTHDEKKTIAFAVYCATWHTVFNIPNTASVLHEIDELKAKYLETFGVHMHSSSIVMIILRGLIIELPDGSFMYNMPNIPDWAQVTLDYLGITTTEKRQR
jgi:hypothetical protein